jgi:molecular chaperone HtpG
VTSDAVLERTKVDLAGLMKVLGESLYSTPNVAIRELVQNAHDSCHRRRIESDLAFEPRISVVADAAAGTLSIEDNGAGLTRDEVERYLATVGAGYTRLLRERDAGAPLIGQFGLGFLSAFIVSERTEVWTCSFKEPDRAWLFSSRSGESYLVGEAEPRPVGTRVLLQLGQKYAELSRERTLRSLLERYCCLLEFPIHCGEGEPVNAVPPPWRGGDDRSPLRQRKLALEFAERFERRFRPLCTIALEREAEADGDARGLLWVQDSATYGTSDNRSVSVFVRGMQVSDDERDLLPSWAGFVGAVIESDALSPTASRESLQKDAGFVRTSERIKECLVAGLSEIARSDPASWRRILTRHNEALLGAALCDERLFKLLARDVTVPTSQGDLTLPSIVTRSGGKVHVTQADSGGSEELLFRALKVPVVHGTRYASLPFCRAYTEFESGTLVVLGTGQGDKALFSRAALPDEQASALKEWFAEPDTEVVLSRFEPSYLPLVLVPDREVELKRRIESDEADRRMSSAVLGMARLFTEQIEARAAARLYLNLSCPAVSALLSAPEVARVRAVRLLKSLVTLLCEVGDERRAQQIDRALGSYCETLEEILGTR